MIEQGFGQPRTEAAEEQSVAIIVERSRSLAQAVVTTTH
jgi:hypothetical protein